MYICMYKQCPDRAYVSEHDIALCFLLASCLLARPFFSDPYSDTLCSIQTSHTRLFLLIGRVPPLPSPPFFFFFFLTLSAHS
ncbi:hypothetical protein F4809DRAFT_593253 [Biscogniauxia mediterranea]|nr:hypothetical protein F4809DRAFT_593253 [Biscogniauxia mediterranea]